MKLKTIIPLFLFCSLLNISKAQTTKEWYFFDQYGVNSGDYNYPYNTSPVSHDSLLFGFISVGSSWHYVYKYTHRQGFIKKTKFVGINGYIEAVDMCIDTTHKFIFTFSRSGPRPPYYKYSHGVIFKLDYDLNILDSLIITYSTLYDPISLALHNNKLYVAGLNNNYFSTPVKTNIAVYDLNLNQLNLKVVSDTTQTCLVKKIIFDNNHNIRLLLKTTANNINFPLMTLDTNLNILNKFCLLNRCNPPNNYFFPTNIVKDDNGFTYTFDDYIYKTNFSPQPYYNQIKNYHLRVNNNEDTINSTYFFKSVGVLYNISHFQKIKNNGYIGLGYQIDYAAYNINDKPNKFFIIDSTLKLINQFDVLKYTTAQLGKIKIGQIASGMYYIVGEAKDSTQTNYKGIFYLMTIDSTAKLIPITPTVITTPPEPTWEAVTVFPNPTNDVVTIALPPNSNYNIHLYNTLGQQLIDFSNVTNNRQISLANLPSGVYHFVFYETLLKKGITKKVVLQKQ